MTDQIKIVIADDHSIVRQGLRQMLDADKQFKVVGEAKNGAQALELIELYNPDVAVLDVDMPQMNGFELARELRQRKIKIEIVFLTMHSEEEIFQTAMDLNASGYVLKDDATIDIVAAVRSVAAGKSFISPALSSLLLNRRRRAEELKSDKPELSLLTPTERRVLQLIAEDKTSREIGDELFISHRTVDTHRLNISRKLNLRGNLALVKFAITHKSEF
jgi:DNA-binding NarL/FixJ family response regulator